jgi:hypothetical protein
MREKPPPIAIDRIPLNKQVHRRIAATFSHTFRKYSLTYYQYDSIINSTLMILSI